MSVDFKSKNGLRFRSRKTETRAKERWRETLVPIFRAVDASKNTNTGDRCHCLLCFLAQEETTWNFPIGLLKTFGRNVKTCLVGLKNTDTYSAFSSCLRESWLLLATFAPPNDALANSNAIYSNLCCIFKDGEAYLLASCGSSQRIIHFKIGKEQNGEEWRRDKHGSTDLLQDNDHYILRIIV